MCILWYAATRTRSLWPCIQVDPSCPDGGRLYLELADYGLQCPAPERETVESIMKAMDNDCNGTLDYEEFAATVKELTKQTLSRLAVPR